MLATLEVNTKFRNDISQGVDLQKTIKQLRKSSKEFEEEQTTKQTQVNNNQEKLQQYEESFTVLQKNLQEKQQVLKEWKEKPVWSHEEFQQQQKLILDQESQLKSFKAKPTKITGKTKGFRGCNRRSTIDSRFFNVIK